MWASIKTSSAKDNRRGFTIVELLIVIVVIGILAAITIVAYNGVQDRARNGQRLSDMSAIVKALEIYKVQNGKYPDPQGNIAGGWESSAMAPTSFISALRTGGVISKVPVDPVNTAPNGAASTIDQTTAYAYYRYPAGYGGCDAARGDYYILMSVANTQNRASAARGFTCPGADYWNWSYWSTGGFTN